MCAVVWCGLRVVRVRVVAVLVVCVLVVSVVGVIAACMLCVAWSVLVVV